MIYCQTPNSGVEVARMEFKAKQVIPPSPEAAELGKYGNVPISLFTGTPNISIPLVELKGGALSLPVSLSYNATGFKPEEIAPWTGLGWALNAGGVITRSVAGNPDVAENYFTPQSPFDIPAYSDEFARQRYYLDVRDKVKETQPDTYYFNFMGHSGKFLIQPDGSIFRIEKDMLGVSSWNVATDDNTFTITDDNGVIYEFTEMEKTIMHDEDDAIGAPPMKTYNFISAWYLSRVISPYGAEELLFEYYTPVEPQSMYNNSIQNRSVSYSVTDNGITPIDGLQVITSVTEAVPPSVSIQRKFLSRIVHKKNNITTGYIDFESAVNEREDLWAATFNGERLLKKIKLYSSSNGSGVLVKEFDLSYIYSCATSTMGEKRLLLQNVQEKSVAPETPDKPPYSFSYTTTTANMPPRFSSGLDHWGFYNAVENRNSVSLIPTLIPRVNISTATPTHWLLFGPAGEGANRESDLSGSILCTINKITYPTGGYTSFEFEGHDAVIYGGDEYHTVGGIRIKKMIDFSFIDKPAIVKTYEYKKEDGTTSGKMGISGLRYDNESKTTEHFCQIGGVPQTVPTYTVSISASSIFGLGTIQGSHVGYERVTEYQTDLSTSQSLGKTVYNYNITGFTEVGDDLGNGDLLKQEIYNNNGKLLQEQVNTYQYNNLGSMTKRRLRPLSNQSDYIILCKDANGIIDYRSRAVCNIPPPCVFSMTVPTQYTYDDWSVSMRSRFLTQQTQKRYDQLSDNYIVTSKSLTYGSVAHDYPTLTEETSTSNDKIFTSVKYVLDYVNQGGGTPIPGSIADNITQMQAKGIINIPIEKLQYRQDVNGTHTRYISGQITDYVMGNPSHIYFLEAQPLLTSLTPSAISVGAFTYDSHYRLAATLNYDNLFNLKEQSKTNDLVKSYIWDYNQIYPVAEVTGASYDQIAYTSFESNGSGRFTVTGIPSPDLTSPTGKQCYLLTGNAITISIDPAKTYMLSYWRKNALNASYSVTGSSSAKQGPTKSGWTYFEHAVAGISNLSVSGNGYIDELRLYPSSAQMTTVSYNPLIGINSQADANNRISYFTYDGLSRLTNVKDDDGNILKSYLYNYGLGSVPSVSSQTLFYNAEFQQDYTKAGCPAGTYGDIITYKIPYGRYVSSISQPDVETKVQTDNVANGQGNANNLGLCRWYNAARTRKLFKNDCLPEQGAGSPVWYTVPYGTFKSTISQSDADAMAQTDISLNGQIYANTHGVCSCGGEGQRVINGICEDGIRINNGTSLQSDEQWKCTYTYLFSNGDESSTYYSYSSNPCPVY